MSISTLPAASTMFTIQRGGETRITFEVNAGHVSVLAARAARPLPMRPTVKKALPRMSFR